MGKVIWCSEVVASCGFLARGANENAVLNCEAEHAREVHGMKKPPEAFMKKARAAIREEACE